MRQLGSLLESVEITDDDQQQAKDVAKKMHT